MTLDSNSFDPADAILFNCVLSAAKSLGLLCINVHELDEKYPTLKCTVQAKVETVSQTVLHKVTTTKDFVPKPWSTPQYELISRLAVIKALEKIWPDIVVLGRKLHLDDRPLIQNSTKNMPAPAPKFYPKREQWLKLMAGQGINMYTVYDAINNIASVFAPSIHDLTKAEYSRLKIEILQLVKNKTSKNSNTIKTSLPAIRLDYDYESLTSDEKNKIGAITKILNTVKKLERLPLVITRKFNFDE